MVIGADRDGRADLAVHTSARMPLILLVDDNCDNRHIYRAVLERDGYAVEEARDGEAGVAAARQHRPVLILMDVGMPVMDGLQATAILKRDPETATILVVALTAHALAADEEDAMSAGVDRFLRKPIEPVRVLELVRQLVGPGKS